MSGNILEGKNKGLADRIGMFFGDVGEKKLATEPRRERTGREQETCNR